MVEHWLLWGALLSGILLFFTGWAAGQVGQQEAVDAAARRAWRAGYRAGVDVWATSRETKLRDRSERISTGSGARAG
jgi:hypothetical protein